MVVLQEQFQQLIVKVTRVNFSGQQMKKMRKYSGATGLKTLPTVPSTFVARSSPHFMAALSGKTQDHIPRKTSVYKNASTLPNVPKKHSTMFRSHLPMIHVTTMEEVDERSEHALSPQRKVSSNGPPWVRGMNTIDTNERYSTASKSSTGRQRKISHTKQKASVLGETPLGRDLIFHRKISNTTAQTANKVNEAEEKERLLTKYSLNNVTLNNDGKKQRIKKTYFSRYNIETAALVKGKLDSNWTGRGRTQSLNFVPKAEAVQIKANTTDKIFTPRVVQEESANDIFGRDRAQSLNFVLRGTGSVRTSPSHDKHQRLREIVEINTQQSPPENIATADSSRPGSLFLYPQKRDYNLDNKLSPTRDNVYTAAPVRKDSQERNAFLTFPNLRAKTWTEN